MAATACTIIARNYLAQARILAESFAARHPGAAVHVLVLDDAEGEIGPGEPFTVVRPDEVLGREELARMATIYTVVELATAVKPALLLRLLAEADGPVAYLDPDILVVEPLDDVLAAADAHGVALTPHALAPLPRDGHVTSTEDVLLDVGVFNLGFGAFGRRGVPALEWWDGRLRRECVIDPPRGRFVDQRWADLFMGYFTPAVMRDPGLNVAWWNLATRRVAVEGDAYTVDGAPLRFFHFSGYDPDMPWLLSRHQGPAPRVLLSDEPALRRITGEYADMLRAHGYDAASARPYALARTPGGLRLDARMREVYRRALIRAESRGSGEPPNPFTDGDAAFLAWLAEPDEETSGFAPTGRYLHDLWRAEAGLRERFPDVHGGDAAGLAAWARTEGVEEGLVAPELAAALSPPGAARSQPDPVPGVDVVGLHDSDGELGEIARRVAEALAGGGVTVARTTLSRPVGPQRASTPPDPDAPACRVLLYCVPPERLREALHQVGPGRRRGRTEVALVPTDGDVPTPPGDTIALVDELWTTTAPAARALERRLDAEVRVLPVPAAEPVDVSRTGVREALGIPGEAHVVAVLVDLADPAQVRTPFLALDAYRRAFPAGDDTRLVIRASHEVYALQALEELRHHARDRADVIVVADTAGGPTAPEVLGAADVLLALRARGGVDLDVLDAMACGVAVVVAGGIPADAGADVLWPVGIDAAGVPDPDAAAAALRDVRRRPLEARCRAAAARALVRDRHAPAQVASFVRARLAEIAIRTLVEAAAGA